MSNKKILQLINRRKQLLEELGSFTQLLHGTWIERYSVCSRKNCRCHQGERHGPRYYVVVNEDGQQRQKYIPLSQVSVAIKGIEQHKQLQTIVDEITQINLELIKEKVYADE